MELPTWLQSVLGVVPVAATGTWWVSRTFAREADVKKLEGKVHETEIAQATILERVDGVRAAVDEVKAMLRERR